jgi:ABC-type microcin C transport system duplicated ATPase subunit YejF
MTGEAILSIRDLRVSFATIDGTVEAVRGVDLHVNAGETVAIVGESGSGKSQAMMAAMQLLASNGKAAGHIDYRGQNLLTLKKSEINAIRGKKISMIFQEPMTSLDPLYSIGNQLIEAIRRHQDLSRADARAEALRLLALVHIPDPERRLRSYPYELSGGQRQRVMIAMALANGPDILIADEPTTALDVTIQAQILTLLAELQAKLGMAIVFITHDLNIVRRLADRVYVMRQGLVVEEGTTERIFTAAEDEYTKMLLAAEPEGRKPPPAPSSPVLLEGRDVSVTFDVGGGFLEKKLVIRAVADVSIRLQRGQTIGIVGESGSGKSTLGRALLRMMPSEGAIRFGDRDISHLHRSEMRPLRKRIQLVFQDPFGSLSPRMTVGQIVSEGLLVHEPSLSSRDRDQRAVEALREVQLDPSTRNRYPHEFSGGQRQRIAIARAIILKPSVVILDEPTSALDRSVQKQIVALLRDLQARHDLSYLFISHDLAVVRAMADYVVVMKAGRIVEEGGTDQIFDRPANDYTRALMAAAVDQARFAGAKN